MQLPARSDTVCSTNGSGVQDSSAGKAEHRGHQQRRGQQHSRQRGAHKNAEEDHGLKATACQTGNAARAPRTTALAQSRDRHSETNTSGAGVTNKSRPFTARKLATCLAVGHALSILFVNYPAVVFALLFLFVRMFQPLGMLFYFFFIPPQVGVLTRVGAGSRST